MNDGGDPLLGEPGESGTGLLTTPLATRHDPSSRSSTDTSQVWPLKRSALAHMPWVLYCLASSRLLPSRRYTSTQQGLQDKHEGVLFALLYRT